MKKIIVLMLVGIFSFVSCAHTVTREELIKSSVMVSTYNVFNVKKASQGSGTAFFVKDVLVTAGHVCVGTYPVPLKVSYVSDKRNDVVSEGIYVAKAVDVQNDICILEPLSPINEKLKNLEISHKKILPGQHIFVVGAPLGVYPVVTEGYAIAEFSDGKIFGISAPTTFGNSGSPVLNDKGELVGMLVAGLIIYEHINFMVPVDYIEHFIEEIEGK